MIKPYQINVTTLSPREIILDTSREDLPKIGKLTYDADSEQMLLELDKDIYTYNGEDIIFRKFCQESNGDMVLLSETYVSIVDRTGTTLTVNMPVHNDFFISNLNTEVVGGQRVVFTDALNFLPEDLYNSTAVTISVDNDASGITLSDLKATTVNGKVIETEIFKEGERIDFSAYYVGDGLDELITLGSYNQRRCRLSCNEYFYINDENELVLWNNVVVSKDNSYVHVPLGLSERVETNLWQEEYVNELFTSDVKGGIIPEPIDMEKIAYTPAYIDENGNVVELENLEYNFHFRHRSGSGWTALDVDDWNNYSMDKSDLLYYLNFTEDDVRNQTEKIRKSGMRLSFYDNDSPIAQQLMYYTTVFLDAGELYGKYCNLKRSNPDYSLSAETDDSNKRVDTKITMANRTVSDKNIHGFYLYFFKEEVNANYPEKTIYMKVEFNHAGYGRILPFLKPYGGESGVTAVPVEEFFDYCYIQLTLKYLPSKNLYVYIINDGQEGITIKKDDRKAIINLFEGKLA